MNRSCDSVRFAFPPFRVNRRRRRHRTIVPQRHGDQRSVFGVLAFGRCV